MQKNRGHSHFALADRRRRMFSACAPKPAVRYFEFFDEDCRGDGTDDFSAITVVTNRVP
jgi:hypothetical protein